MNTQRRTPPTTTTTSPETANPSFYISTWSRQQLWATVMEESALESRAVRRRGNMVSVGTLLCCDGVKSPQKCPHWAQYDWDTEIQRRSGEDWNSSSIFVEVEWKLRMKSCVSVTNSTCSMRGFGPWRTSSACIRLQPWRLYERRVNSKTSYSGGDYNKRGIKEIVNERGRKVRGGDIEP